MGKTAKKSLNLPMQKPHSGSAWRFRSPCCRPHNSSQLHARPCSSAKPYRSREATAYPTGYGKDWERAARAEVEHPLPTHARSNKLGSAGTILLKTDTRLNPRQGSSGFLSTTAGAESSVDKGWEPVFPHGPILLSWLIESSSPSMALVSKMDTVICTTSPTIIEAMDAFLANSDAL